MNLSPVLQTDCYRTWVSPLLFCTNMFCSHVLCMGTEPSWWKRLETRSVIVTLSPANTFEQSEECDAYLWNAACPFQKVCLTHHSLLTLPCTVCLPGYHQVHGVDAQGLQGYSFSRISFNAAPLSASWPTHTLQLSLEESWSTHTHAHTHANGCSVTSIATIVQKASWFSFWLCLLAQRNLQS